jgi:hypothetical protein
MRAGTHGVTGYFLFRTPGLSLLFSNTNKCDAHLFCSSRSPSILVSDAEKRVVNRAVAPFISAVFRLSSVTPLSVCDSTYLRRARWAKKEAKRAKIKTAAL